MAAHVTAASVHDFKLFSIFVKKKPIVILKFSMKFQTKLKYESNLKHSSSRSII
jgi:hypothetical protein